MPSPVHYLLQQSANNGGLVGLMNSADFILPLTDAGSGIVSTSLARGVGPATFTRATVAWTKLSSGLWAQIASGSPRSCYLGLTTATGNYGGYLAEGAGIQLVTPTASIRDMTDASWVKGATLTVAKTGTGIDGVVNSCSRLTGGAVAATNTALQTLAAAASSRTYSCWIRRVTGTGTVSITQDGAAFTDVTSQLTTANFVQVQLNASQLNAAFGLKVDTAGDVILVDFNQFEAGTVATTPMDSAGASRNADSLTYPSAGNIGAIGTIYNEFNSPNVVADSANFPRLVMADDGVEANNSIIVFLNGGTPVVNGRVITATLTIVTDATANNASASLVNKTAFSFAAGAYSITLNAGTVATSAAAGALPTVTTIRIGNRPSADRPTNGTVKNARIWQRQLADATLQAMTI